MNSRFQQSLATVSHLLQTSLFKLGDQSVSLLWILKLILTLIAVVLLARLLKHLLRNQVLIQLRMNEGHREALSTLMSYSIGTFGFVVALQASGLNLAPFLVALGGLGIGVGFGLQEITKNLISGVTLLIEGKLQVGDYVEFDGLSGYIKEISVRSTIIRTFDGGDVVVPNSSLTGNRILNWSYKNLSGKIRVPISVAYGSDTTLVTETLLNSAYMEPNVSHEPPPKVIFKGFGDDALLFELWAWIAQIDEGISVKSSLNFIIDHNFRQAGIKIPFPQRELWINTPEAFQLQDRNVSDRVHTPSAIRQRSEHFSHRVSIRELLQKIPHFNLCPDLHLRELIEAGYRKVISESECVFEEGEMGSHFYLILSGSVESSIAQLQKTIRVHHAGEIFGEAPVMLELTYQTTARALEETILFVIHRKSFERILRSNPGLAEVFAHEITKETELYQEVRRHLEELGLLHMSEHNSGFVGWAKIRLRQLLNGK